MKKTLFLHFGDLFLSHGISKKIIAQKNALAKNGDCISLTHVHYNTENGWEFYVDNRRIGIKRQDNINKHKLLYTYPLFYHYIKENDIKNIYWRWSCFTPGQFLLLLRLKYLGCRVIMEIPTYPYDKEWPFDRYDWIANLPRRSDSVIRHFWKFFIYRIVTFSSDRYIYGVPCINISNGYIPDLIQIKKQIPFTTHLHMIAVAMVQWWHGFDRIIQGLRYYYKTSPSIIVSLTIVGDGEIKQLKQMVEEYGLSDFVHFTGAISGEPLHAEFDKAHIAIGSLGRHRSGISTMKSLKNVEYASRGIPFIYSENNSDFDGNPFVMKVPADESPLDIQKVIEFYKSQPLSPAEIHKFAEPYSWDNQIEAVAKEFLNEYD